jgi:hypothetical protein
MSWLSTAPNSSGPVVGRLSTIEMIVSPLIRPGSSQPTVLKNGLSDIRTGYLSSSFHSGIPLARAVTTYGLYSSSSRFALVTLIRLAVPEMPMINTGNQRWEARSSNLPRFQTASAYSGENSPPTL